MRAHLHGLQFADLVFTVPVLAPSVSGDNASNEFFYLLLSCDQADYNKLDRMLISRLSCLLPNQISKGMVFNYANTWMQILYSQFPNVLKFLQNSLAEFHFLAACGSKVLILKEQFSRHSLKCNCRIPSLVDNLWQKLSRWLHLFLSEPVIR